MTRVISNEGLGIHHCVQILRERGEIFLVSLGPRDEKKGLNCLYFPLGIFPVTLYAVHRKRGCFLGLI